MSKLFSYCILLFIIMAMPSRSQEIIRKALNAETFKEWDAYIKQYAPSDSAFNVVVSFANRHHLSGRSILSCEVFNMYKPLFPERRDVIEKQVEILSQFALNQEISSDLIGYFVKFINQNAPKPVAFLAVQRLSGNFLDKRDWDSAAYVYSVFKPLFPDYGAKINAIISIIKAPSENLQARNLGAVINTRGNEWDPTPTHEGNLLYFSSDHRPGGFGQSDVWNSSLQNGQWTKPANAGSQINGKKDETIDNITLDGNGILLSGTYDGTFGNFDIYFKERTSEGWSSMIHFPKPINTIYTDEGGNITADGQAILFTSDRPGGIGPFQAYGSLYNGGLNGNMDIYVCMKTDSGWSEAINLGSKVNTAVSERSPYLHPDGKTLYFSSEGHNGLGKLDVFKTVRLSEESWTEWSEPVNLGKEINSGGDDWGYKITLNGDSAFFAGYNREDGHGGWDLYTINLPKAHQANIVSVIIGKVKDKNGKALSARIIWEDLTTAKQIGSLTSNPNDGSYIIALPKGKVYGYYAEKSGYYPYSDNINLKDMPDTLIHKDIVLLYAKDLITDKSHLTINNIFFEFDKYELKKESFLELDRLAGFIKQNNVKTIQIIGYTDDIGSTEYNLELSQNRAESVCRYLISKGIPKSQLVAIGKGKSISNDKDDLEKERAKRRRVEIYFE